jgi:DNA ligase (NAD+)
MDWDLVAQFAGNGIAKRAKESLERSGDNIDFASFISGLNIRHCDSLAKNLVEAGIDTPEKLTQVTVESLNDIEGVGKTKAKAIYDSVQQLQHVILQLGNTVSFAEKSGSLVGKSFCFTGAMKHQRKELESMVLDNGGEAKKSVSKGLTYLVLADPNSGSTKAQKARKLGTTCISEDEFLGMCGG